MMYLCVKLKANSVFQKPKTGLIGEVASKRIFPNLLNHVYHTKHQRKPAMHQFCPTLTMGKQSKSMFKHNVLR